MDKAVELIKSLIRPFLVVWGWIIYGVCVWNEIEVPAYLLAILGAVTAEYTGERIVKRIKEIKSE